MPWLLLIFALGALLAPQLCRAADAQGEADKKGENKIMVRVKVFDADGKLVGPLEMPKLVRSDNEWKVRLTDEQYRIARGKGTERPFCGLLLDQKEAGVYSCVCCGLPLFASNSKFNSGTGWPSFFAPIAKENVVEHSDRSLGMLRTEILCVRCDAHLGHVFEDGPRPTGLRYCLNSESLVFTPATELKKLAEPVAGDQAAARSRPAEAVFAGGCFWCTEAVFEQIDGVLDVVSGYAGGTEQTANYDAVCSGSTAHAEAIKISYDPARVSYQKLLAVFFDTHDPTQLNRQGPDSGKQYRSAVFYADEQQHKAAESYIAELTKKKAYPRPIVTTLEPLKAFFPAEEYHQDFARRNPNYPYIQQQALPKLDKLRKHHPDEVKK